MNFTLTFCGAVGSVNDRLHFGVIVVVGSFG